MQESIFDIIYPQFKINKPIRLITLFSGYDSQALALNYLGVKYEHYKTCEWAIKSIQALKDLHFGNDNRDYSFGIDIEEIKMFLLKKGISQNYNEPMNEQQIKRMSEPYARQIYNNIIATNNLVNIQQVKGRDLEVKNTDRYIYICTYSFPCQDLSLAGKGKGFSDTSTRSGMLWEVERILSEMDERPQVLLMENVPQVHSEDNKKDFFKWQLRLEELGYKNYVQDLIATDYGIPQTRNRCFMVSILGEYSYKFPKPIPLKLKLKDLLEENVDEKYYLSDKMIKYISADNQKWTGNNGEALINKTYASTLNTNEGSRRCDASNYISEDVEENYNLKTKVIRKYGIFDKKGKTHQAGSVYDKNGLSPTLDTASGSYRQPMIEEKMLIKNANSKGYLEAYEGDGIDISSRMQYHRGTVQKQKAQTISTMGGENVGVIVNE